MSDGVFLVAIIGGAIIGMVVRAMVEQDLQMEFILKKLKELEDRLNWPGVP